METHLTDVELKSGEAMRIVRIDAPDPAWQDRILPFLQHKGEPWLWQMELALEEGLGACEQRYYLGVLEGGEVVGNIMTTELMERPVGILGHVFTPPAHRRKGICSHLMVALTEDFRARGGRAMFLHTGYDSRPTTSTPRTASSATATPAPWPGCSRRTSRSASSRAGR